MKRLFVQTALFLFLILCIAAVPIIIRWKIEAAFHPSVRQSTTSETNTPQGIPDVCESAVSFISPYRQYCATKTITETNK